MNCEKVSKSILWVGLVFILFFGAPILGTISAFSLAEFAECPLSAARSVDCNFMGLNIGKRLYPYTIPLVGSIFTPVAMYHAFKDILIVWLIILLLSRYFCKKMVIKDNT